MKYSELLEYSERIRNDPSLKGALARSYYRLVYQNQKNFISGATLTICKENIQIAHVVMITRKDFFLVDALNKKIELLKESGLIEFWRMQFIDMNSVTAKVRNHPQVITLDQMQGIVYILMIGYLVSVTAFWFEIALSYRLKSH